MNIQFEMSFVIMCTHLELVIKKMKPSFNIDLITTEKFVKL